MSWQPIDSAPRDKPVLLWGSQDPITEDGCTLLNQWTGAISGYWDHIDETWCSTASTWRGPFINATHWMPLPSPPTPGDPQ